MRVLRLNGVRPPILTGTVAVSILAVALTTFQQWPAWAVVAAGIGPWIPVLTLELDWARRHYGWLALFYLLVITQGGHVIEHVVQVTQIHVFSLEGLRARGIFGALDIEWVHFLWNTWVLAAVVALFVRFRRNPWLLFGLAFALWHEIEHAYIMWTFLTTDVAGTPGLLAEGGRIAGGTGVSRPDLHFYYNVVETTPLIAGFVYQLCRMYDDWLARVFPKLDRSALVGLSLGSRTRHVESGEVVVREGDAPGDVFVVVKGRFQVTRKWDGRARWLATVGPGRYFGENAVLTGRPRSASVRATTGGELIELDGKVFASAIESSAEAADEVRRTAAERIA
jgi:hypothetical protein